MDEESVAGRLLSMAERDAGAFRLLATAPTIHDSIVGFHAQQVVEKALKAVLSAAVVPFRRTHDIAELVDLLADAGLVGPPHAGELDELNPYAVEMRYGLVDPSGLDRPHVEQVIGDVLGGAREAVDNPRRR